MIVSITQKRGLLSIRESNWEEKDIKEKSGLSIEDFVKIEAYRNCNQAN